jgi:hypothetical protein
LKVNAPVEVNSVPFKNPPPPPPPPGIVTFVRVGVTALAVTPAPTKSRVAQAVLTVMPSSFVLSATPPALLMIVTASITCAMTA